MKKIIIGITGASGSIYGKRMVEVLLENQTFVVLIATENGKKVFSYELDLDFDLWSNGLKEKYENFTEEDIDNLFAGAASGSYDFDSVIILPCSMGTLGKIANGISSNLLMRAADVALKERRDLILVPRETPLHQIHLENMLKISRCGGTIMPAMPGFYHKPQTKEDLVDFVIGKILNYMKIENNLFGKWGNGDL